MFERSISLTRRKIELVDGLARRRLETLLSAAPAKKTCQPNTSHQALQRLELHNPASGQFVDTDAQSDIGLINIERPC